MTQAPPAVPDDAEAYAPLSRRQQVFVWMAAFFVTSLILANLIGSMLFSFRLPFALPLVGDKALLSAGIIPFPVTFILTDLVNEFYGEKGARFVTFVGFGMSIMVYLYLTAGDHLPLDAVTLIQKSQYSAISANYAGMFVASLAAYLVGQLLDIRVFHIFKQITGSRFIWLRATGSTVISQVFDSLVVTFVAFTGDLPVTTILQIAGSNYVWKFLIAVGITPVLYLGHILIRRVLDPVSVRG
ncbi:MAG: queuosine precursor transporter [Candidatus Melainabacteria bacterium]